jgi:hypothetical protein
MSDLDRTKPKTRRRLPRGDTSPPRTPRDVRLRGDRAGWRRLDRRGPDRARPGGSLTRASRYRGGEGATSSVCCSPWSGWRRPGSSPVGWRVGRDQTGSVSGCGTVICVRRTPGLPQFGTGWRPARESRLTAIAVVTGASTIDGSTTRNAIPWIQPCQGPTHYDTRTGTQWAIRTHVRNPQGFGYQVTLHPAARPAQPHPGSAALRRALPHTSSPSFSMSAPAGIRTQGLRIRRVTDRAPL